MFCQVRRLAEAALAVLALERLFPIMRPLVDRQRARDSECLPAAREIADEWLYMCRQTVRKS